ncbi:MAG: ribosome-associated translation inhibitor RaiA [Elusimicrobia bacterium]|nr:ribosome-associated translation inhibitor RaiA [Elusimicrobiota bacterium]
MLVSIRAMKVKVRESLLDYIKEKLSKTQKYSSKINKIEVFLSQQKYMCTVDIIINVSGQTVKIHQRSTDFHSAVDIAVDKISQQLRKQKERLKEHRKLAKFPLGKRYFQLENIALELTRKKFNPQVLSVDDAVESMEESNYKFFIFKNDENGKISVVYKKEDLTYGLIEI